MAALARGFGAMAMAAAVLAAAVLAAPRGEAAEAAPVAFGRIDGAIKDALDRPLAGARLRLESYDGKQLGGATSDADGRFRLPQVAPGVYSLIGEKAGFDATTIIVTVTAGQAARAELVLAAQRALDLDVSARRLDAARNAIQPKTGASVYEITRRAIDQQPQGANAPFNQVLLQAPGVHQDSFGQIHVRDDHGEVQYRINGVQLPEGITGFGQTLPTRFAERIDLLRGALPAQYGFRTAGVIDIQTKSGAFDQGGSTGIYGGSRDTAQANGEWSGSAGRFSWFCTGEFVHSNLGIEAPTTAADPLHDEARQGKGFAYLSYLVDPSTRISGLFGAALGNFQIPNRPNQPPGFTVSGVSSFDSARLDSSQKERNYYGVLALQQSTATLDYQLSWFSRYSNIGFTPDPLGSLVFSGVASKVYRESFVNGIQGDGSWRIASDHTLRSGLAISRERTAAKTLTTVLPLDDGGNPLDTPFAIADDSHKVGWLYGVYLQDEWRLTSRLTFNFGARFDYLDSFTSATQLSPRVNAVYKLTDSTTLHGGYSRYFVPPPQELVAPTAVSKFASTTNAPAITADDKAVPERSTYYDAGVTQQLAPGLQVGLDAYYRRSKHLLDDGLFGQALILSPINYRTGKNYGVELSTSYDTEVLSAYGNIAYSRILTRAVESSQFLFDADEFAVLANHFTPLEHDQRLTGSLGLSYLWRDIRWSGDALYGSGLRRGFANGEHEPGYWQVNLGLSYRFDTAAFGQLTARADVINLLDRTYVFHDGTGIGVGAPKFGPGRAFFAGLSRSF